MAHHKGIGVCHPHRPFPQHPCRKGDGLTWIQEMFALSRFAA